MHSSAVRFALASVVALGLSSRAYAQQPPPPQPAAPAPEPKLWTGTAGAGLALTSGNSDTLTLNLVFDVTRDPKTKNVIKAKGLYLRGEENDSLTVNRIAFAGRDEYSFTPRTFVFGQLEYLRDTFKLIDYLVAPTAGIGYKIVNTDVTKFTVDAGAGVAWEKNPDVDVRTSGAISAGEKVEHKLTATSTIKQSTTALWKANDFADGLYTFSAGLGTTITDTVQLSIEFLDTFKNKPPTAETKKNDVALVTALTAKF